MNKAMDAAALPGAAPPVPFAQFVAEHTPGLYRTAVMLTRQPASAEDLVQETFTRLYPVWTRVAAADSPYAYVRRALMNNFLNTRRTKSGHELLFDDEPDRVGAPDPAAAISDQDLVRRLLDQLEPRPRAVLVLKFLHDLTDEQIAAELGCRPATVRSISSRALRSLRADLGGEPPAAPRVKGLPS